MKKKDIIMAVVAAVFSVLVFFAGVVAGRETVGTRKNNELTFANTMYCSNGGEYRTPSGLYS